ncbi:MAG TPA: CPBP family intramembrane glutamic endopeptidase [Bacillus sp. (in: firmicutes)]|nr:CPBP family intramembrane glutamic endopeptidase [Bacillus sp. (in: firmicutes)]
MKYAVSKTNTLDNRVKFARKGLILFFFILIFFSIVGYWLTHINAKWILFLMWTPGLASIIVRLILREGLGDISLRLGGRSIIKVIPLVLLLPVTVGLIAYGIAWTTGLAQFVAPETYLKAPPIVMFILFLLFNAIIGTIYGLIGSIGEEIGWRGYMLSRLVEAQVPYPLILSGVIWGTWHIPLMIIGDYYSGPALAISIFLFMISAVAFGYVIGRLRLSTGSIWPPIILHSAWNAVIQNAFGLFTQGDSALLWTGESGILVALTLLIVAFVYSRKSNVYIKST